MKIEQFIGGSLLLLLLMIFAAFMGMIYEKSKISLPEEIQTLSINPNKPDTLIGYKTKSGIIYIGYKNSNN